MNPQLQGTTRGISLQGSGNTLQQAAPVQMAAGANFLQPAGPTGAAAPAMQQPVQPAGPSPEQIAAQQQAAEEAAQRSNLQKGIQKLVGEAMGVYDTLFGNLQTAGASQRQALESKYGSERQALGEQFAQEIPRIGQAFAARGAYSSSWRGRAEQTAQDKFAKQLETMQREREAAGQKLGQEVATQEAQFRAGQRGLSDVLARIPGTTDITELTALQSEIQKKINELQASSAGLQSQESFMQRFEQLTPMTDRTAQLRQTLSTIIQGEAPAPLKQSVAAQIIGSSGLTEEEQQALLAEVTAQLTPAATSATA